MKYIVYITICTVNNKFYIGVHQTENPEIFDGYIGCGVRINDPGSYKKSKTPFQYAVNKYGVDAFKRITLSVFENKEDAFTLESQLVNEAFIKRPDTYNIKIGGAGDCPEVLKRKVYMYDLSGAFVREFDTVYECNKFFYPNAKSGGHIPRAIKLGHVINGYQFSYEKLPYMKCYNRKHGSHKPIKVGRYDSNWNLLEVYNSVTSCKMAGYGNITRALKQKIKCKGFFFDYIKE